MNTSYCTLSTVKLFLLLALLTLLYSSCKDDLNNIGIGIQPEEDFITITLDTLDFQVEMVKADSIIVTNGVIFPQIGTYSDPQFGITKNTFYSQFDLPGALLDLGNADSLILDSIVLVLTCTQRNYGTLIPQDFQINELENDIFEDSTYYSSTSISTFVENIIEPGFETTSVSNADMFNRGDSVFSELRFRLKDLIGQSFLEQSGEPAFSSDENFQDFFKGISLESNTLNGGLISIFPSGINSGIQLYYRDNGIVLDTLQVTFPFNNESSFSSTSHDYSTAEFGEFSEPVIANQNIYLQGVEGILAHVEITNLSELEISDLTAINKAELIIPVAQNSTLSYDPPSILYLLSAYDSESAFLSDMCGGLNRGGLYNEELHAYVFNISLHIGDMIKGDALPEFWITSNVPDNINVESSCQTQLIQVGVLFPSFLDERRVILNGPEYSSQDETQNMRITLTLSE